MPLDFYAGNIDEAVKREIEQARKLEAQGFYTEASLRLGRGVEAALYSVGRSLKIDLTSRSIEEVAKLQQTLREIEVSIMRDRTSAKVRDLANLAKAVGICIASLSEEEELRGGIASEEHVRPNEQILREMLSSNLTPDIKRRLGGNKAVLRTLQIRRNSAAHASLDGTLREVSQEEYQQFLNELEPLLEALSDFKTGLLAAERYQIAPLT